MTGCERILARLGRGPATAAELYAETFTVVHSRISDLRKRGYVITCEHTGGHDASSYLYRLLGGAECNGTGQETARDDGLSLTALRSSEQRDQALLKIANEGTIAEAARAYIRGRVRESDNGVCWLWPVADSDGYGRAHFRARTFRAPRLSYTVFIGPIPEGLTLDHLCRNRVCVNPAHLEPVTNHENLLRAPRVINARTRTHCEQGHEFTPENTARYPDGRGSISRRCRECWNAARRLAYATSVGKTGEQVASSRRRDAPSPRAACSPIQLELETEFRFGSGLSPYASGESRAA